MAGAVMNKIWNLFGVDTNAEEEEENEVSPLSIEEIDNVSMVKPKETTSVITKEEALEESDEISEEEQDDYEAEIEDELDELDDALMEGDEK